MRELSAVRLNAGLFDPTCSHSCPICGAALPPNCILNNLRQRRMTWGPAKETPGQRRIGDKAGWIAVATRAYAMRHFSPESAAYTGHDLGDRMTFPCPNIDSLECPGRQFDGEGRDVGGGKVRNVDIVAQAGPIGGIEIPTKDNEGLAVAERRGDGQRQQVCFGFVRLSDQAGRIGPGGVEVTQGDRRETIGSTLRSDHPFSSELGVAVGTGGRLFSCLLDQFVRAATALPIDGCA